MKEKKRNTVYTRKGKKYLELIDGDYLHTNFIEVQFV